MNADEYNNKRKEVVGQSGADAPNIAKIILTVMMMSAGLAMLITGLISIYNADISKNSIFTILYFLCTLSYVALVIAIPKINKKHNIKLLEYLLDKKWFKKLFITK